MANYEKFVRGDYGLFAHCERKKDEFGNYITFGNERIDPSKTHLNYNLCPDNREQREILEARLSDPNIKCMNRADVVVFGSWCVTLPTHAPDLNENGGIIYEEKEVHHRDGTVTVENVPRMHEVHYNEEQIKLFFLLVYMFLVDRYGEENVISAYVHMDETTPHMHFLFMPVIDDKKWNEIHPDKPPRKKVCAKELMNKTEMSMFHRVLQEYLDEHSEKDLYPVLNGTTIGGARTIADLKAESALEEAIMASAQANATKEHAEAEIAQIDAEVESTRKSAKEYIETLHKHEEEAEKETEAWLEHLEQKELPAIKELQDSLSDLGVPKDQYSNMKTLAETLNNPIKSKSGKTYVEIPNPEATLPILKKLVRKVIAVIEKVKDITDQVKEQVTRTRVSMKERLAASKKEADRQNAERRAAEREKGIVRKPGKNEHTI